MKVTKIFLVTIPFLFFILVTIFLPEIAIFNIIIYIFLRLVTKLPKNIKQFYIARK